MRMAESGSQDAVAFSGLVAGIAAAAQSTLQQIGALMDGKPLDGATGAGEAGSPEGRAASIQMGLTNVRHFIDTVVMLQQKTKGNLTQEEGQLVNAVLTDLRISFVKLNDRWGAMKSG
jgi:hypothetical protein